MNFSTNTMKGVIFAFLSAAVVILTLTSSPESRNLLRLRNNATPRLLNLMKMHFESPSVIFDRTKPSMVFIESRKSPLELNETEHVPKGIGSGFIWDREGHIITNTHVVDGAETVTVTISVSEETDKRYSLAAYSDPDGSIKYRPKKFMAHVIGVDPHTGVAIIEFDSTGVELMPISLAESKDPTEIGETAYVVGNPKPSSHSISTGIVLDRAKEILSPSGITIKNAIDTNAEINPTNSGGPVLSASGRFMGLAITPGVIIPCSIVQESIDEIMKRVEHIFHEND